MDVCLILVWENTNIYFMYLNTFSNIPVYCVFLKLHWASYSKGVVDKCLTKSSNMQGHVFSLSVCSSEKLVCNTLFSYLLFTTDTISCSRCRSAFFLVAIQKTQSRTFPNHYSPGNSITLTSLILYKQTKYENLHLFEVKK